MGALKVDALDFNEIQTLEAVHTAIAEIASRADSYRGLRFKSPHYFEAVGSRLPSEPGWYIILDGTQPLYVGKTNNLDSRLNTDDGSRDNFGNHARKHDLMRNFIKKFIEIGAVKAPRACIIRTSELVAALGMPESRLSELDAGNVEKVINLTRGGIAYQ